MTSRRSRVAVLRADDYDPALEHVVHEGIRMTRLPVAGRRILLKPNLVEPHGATNTDPRLVAAAIAAFRALGAAEVIVAEGSGHRRDTHYLLDACGLADVLDATSTPFVDLNLAPVLRVELSHPRSTLTDLWLPSILGEVDLVVSMPKLKTHHWTGLTASLKNCFGCVPGRVYGWPKNALHWAGIHEAIVDVADAVAPGAAIVDGIVAMEGDGPVAGRPLHAGVVVFGDDPLAVDVTCCRLMDIVPSQVGYLRISAEQAGAMPDIEQVGEDPNTLARAFALLPELSWLRQAPDVYGPTMSRSVRRRDVVAY